MMHQDDLNPEVQADDRSMIMVEVNGAQYPMKRIPQCRTCTSEYRREIEQMILDGVSYQKIVDVIADRPVGRWPHPMFSSVRNHVRQNHMPIGPTMERALIERRSQQIGRDIEGSAESLIDYQTANELIIQRGMARFMRGELKPSMSDLANAIRTQHTIDQSAEGGLDSAAWEEALLAYMEVAQQFVPVERHQEFGRALAHHPVLRAMAAKASATPAIEGEVVREGIEG